MRILVSGATGYLGYNFIKLAYKSYDVYIVVRNDSDLSKVGKYIEKSRIIKLTQCNSELYRAVESIKPDYFVHFAGLFLGCHDERNINQLLDSNITFATVLLDAVCKAGCKKIINTETYWQNYKKEEYNPVNLYAATKRAFADIIKYYAECYECKVINLKIFDTYGPKDNRNKLLNKIKDMKSGEAIELTECYQKVFYVYIDDVVRGYLIALDLFSKMEKGKIVTYAIRDNEPLVLKDVILMLRSFLQKDIIFHFGMRPMREREIIDPSNIGFILPGWNCTIPLEIGLKKMLEE